MILISNLGMEIPNGIVDRAIFISLTSEVTLKIIAKVIVIINLGLM